MQEIVQITPNSNDAQKQRFTQMEVNFLQYPIGVLDKNHKFRTAGKDEQKKYVLSFKREIPAVGGVKTLEWRVVGSGLYGLPGPTAVVLDNVIAKLIQDEAKEIGAIPRWIKSTYYELCKEMGIGNTGPNIKRLKHDLKCLATISFEQVGAFRTKSGKILLDNPIIRKYDSIVLKGESIPSELPGEETNVEGLANHIYIVLSPIYWNSLNENYTKGINYEFMTALRNPVLQRMYQLLSLAFATNLKSDDKFGVHVNYNYFELCGRIPIKAWDKPYDAKSHISVYIKQLVESGYIESFELYFDRDKSDWYIKFKPGNIAVGEIEILSGQKLMFDNKFVSKKSIREKRKLNTVLKKVEEKKEMRETMEEEFILSEIKKMSQDAYRTLESEAKEIYSKKYGNNFFIKRTFDFEMIEIFKSRYFNGGDQSAIN